MSIEEMEKTLKYHTQLLESIVMLLDEKQAFAKEKSKHLSELTKNLMDMPVLQQNDAMSKALSGLLKPMMSMMESANNNRGSGKND